MSARLATFAAREGRFYGAAVKGGAVALSPDFPRWKTLREAVAANGMRALADAAAGRAPTHPDGEFRWDIPIPDPEKIICVGVNFPDRNAEYGDASPPPQNPSLFVRFPRSFVGHGENLIRPKESAQLDYEGEIAVVIGRGGRRIPEARALEHLAALTLCNDGTLRDWTRHGKFNVTQGKNFEKSGAMGPWLVPFESPAQILDARLTARVNGETRQDDRTGRMVFSIARQIAYISAFTELTPGDIIATGTPAGAGARMSPPVFLKPGDTVEVEAEGIGILRNGVAEEK